MGTAVVLTRPPLSDPRHSVVDVRPSLQRVLHPEGLLLPESSMLVLWLHHELLIIDALHPSADLLPQS